jgi:CheY-like chemotaxis protein/two-component sensor histidine kinase
MNAIMGFSELLPLNYDNKPKLEKFSEIIRQRASDLLDLINDLLDIARIESGQLNLHIDNCTIATVFSELQSFFVEYQTRANKNDIVFLLEMDEITQKLTMRTDRIKLKQIFINLISNAFKFTKTGIVKGGCKLLPDGKIYFYVSDTGIGIPAELQKHVFERFAQIQTNTNAVIVGTGLGLSIVKGLVEILGGKIHLYSIPNVGSTFSFILPRIAATADTQSQTSSSLRPSHTNIFHILLVEDDPANALFLIEILQEANYRVTHVDCAQKALATIKTHSINLVLMDIRLPDVNGYEATSIIKKMYPNLPIIAQTAYATNEDRIKSMTAGCDDYISKPIVKGELYNILNYWLSKVKE